MRSLIFSIILIISTLNIIGCVVDEKEKLFKDGLETLMFPCNDSTSEYYFRGKFVDDSICLYHNQFDCYAKFDQWSSWVTTEPTTTIGDTVHGGTITWIQFGIQQWVPRNDDTLGGYVGKDFYGIRTPKMLYNSSATTDSLVLTYLQPGQSLFWQHGHSEYMNEDLGIPQGLEVYIFKNHYNSAFKKDHIQLHLTSARGNQIDSYIEIMDLNLNEIGNHVEGNVHLRFKCKMYLDIHGKYDGDYDGEFVGDFSGEVNMPISYDR